MHAMSLVWLLILANIPQWPGFLGVGAGPVDVNSIPFTWSAGDSTEESSAKNIAWVRNLPGYGQSSPVIWNDQVFVTTVEGPMKETFYIIAMSIADGEVRWKHEVKASSQLKNSIYVSRAAPTPVTDGDALYVFFESGDVCAVTLDGKRLWERSLSNEYGAFQNEFGLASSPVQTEESIIVLVDDKGPSYLIALSKKDGSVVWKTDRTSRNSWSSPALAKVDGKSQVVCSSDGSIDGYDPATGELLWTYTDIGGNSSATPNSFSPGKFLIGASLGQDGKNADAVKKSNLAMGIEVVDGKPTPKVLWRNEDATSSFGSPIVHDGNCYWVNRSGVVFCLDAQTGKQHYAKRIKQSVWATPVGIGDRVYFFGKDGLTTVLQSGPEFKVLAENQLWDPNKVEADEELIAQETDAQRRQAAAMFAKPVQYGAAVIDGSLFIRTGRKLFCIRTQE